MTGGRNKLICISSKRNYVDRRPTACQVLHRTGTDSTKMRDSLKRSRDGRRVAPAEARSADLEPMVATKLWRNPCWLSFRANFIAHHFNQPLYDLIQARYRLTPPEHVVLYALGLQEGI